VFIYFFEEKKKHIQTLGNHDVLTES
jgi:hypothetical protein